MFIVRESYHICLFHMNICKIAKSTKCEYSPHRFRFSFCFAFIILLILLVEDESCRFRESKPWRYEHHSFSPFLRHPLCL